MLQVVNNSLNFFYVNPILNWLGIGFIPSTAVSCSLTHQIDEAHDAVEHGSAPCSRAWSSRLAREGCAYPCSASISVSRRHFMLLRSSDTEYDVLMCRNIQSGRRCSIL